MKLTKYIIFTFLCVAPLSLHADPNPIEAYFKFKPEEATGCNSSTQIDSNTSVTFYGDSRGDFVDLSPIPSKDIPAIEDGGFLGWPAYLGAGSGAVPGNPAVWNVQNQAVGGWTTVDLYKAIVRCSNANNFAVYKTATRYAVEIGANDAVRNSLYALFMPWIFPKIQQRIQTNQRAVVELLKAALSGRGITNPGDNILFMETLPVISRGPVHGTPEEQCFSWWNFCNIMTPGEANTYEMVLAIAKGRGNLNKTAQGTKAQTGDQYSGFFGVKNVGSS